MRGLAAFECASGTEAITKEPVEEDADEGDGTGLRSFVAREAVFKILGGVRKKPLGRDIESEPPRRNGE